MKQKRLIQLLAVLGVLLLLAWLSGVFEGAPSTVETPEISVDLDQLESVEIRKGNEHVALARMDGNWMLTQPVEADVDTTTQSTFLNSVDGITIESLISSRAEGYDRYQVDSAQATYLRFGSGSGQVELYVGKSGPDFQSNYVRIGGDDRVFLATGLPTAQPSVDRWRNKILWDHPEASVTQVSVTTPESAYTLRRMEGGWILDEGGSTASADSAKTARYLTRISTVRADGFLLDLSSELVADSARHHVEVTKIDGSTSSLTMWSRDNDAAAIASGLDDIAKLNSYRVRSFAPESSELKSE